ncbi:MAG: ABC transporter substrate-binding protein [Deltaproteobacteria bacterium]|jgi:ABC-type uncharacterized transport system substrate-binding protein|nr:ABC transporter substrate-binding protein [Deltaproteobacteria bacterium]
MQAQLDGLRRLFLGLAIITGVAAILLISDLDSRRNGALDSQQAASAPSVALVQHASLEPLDDGVDGILDALAARGFEDGEGLNLRRYNAQGDITTSNTIAKEVTSADVDLIISVSTLSLQTVASANRFQSTPRRHVFGITSNPFKAGVGISSEDPLDHPPYMAGLGSLPPVRDLFVLLKQIQPEARRVGLVWNPAEANSEAATLMARAVSEELGLELIEGNAETSTAAGEVALSVMARGVDVLWVSPDITVSTALEVMVDAARRAGVPVITSLPGSTARGAMLDLGANYYEIGFIEGTIAADILQGRDPSTIPIENWMPVELHLNLSALDGLRMPWVIPDAIVQRASRVIDGSGVREQDIPADPSPASLRWNREDRTNELPWIDIVQYIETPNAEISRNGVIQGLSEAGMLRDRDFRIRVHSAQGDIPTLVSIVDALVSRESDLILTLSTPALQTALRRDRGIPIVFGMVSNPFIVGAGTSDRDHAPTVTGAYLDQPVEEMLDVIRQLFPEAKKLGTLYTPAEINSEFNMDQLKTAAEKDGYEVETVGIATAADVVDASIALASTRPDVWVQITDNLISSSFPAVMEAANREHIPVVTFSPTAVEYGPLMVVARDYFDAGQEAGLIAARVLRGEPVEQIPFQPTKRLRYLLNPDAATQFGITFPPELVILSTAEGH